MAVSPSPDDNFIHGLSDFWVTFFRDADRLRDVYEAQAVQYGQLYLDLLDAVLGISLEHVPLFSKRYFKDFYVREDELLFSEGSSDNEDKWVFVTEDKLFSIAWLMNRVVAPTTVLEPVLDYNVVEGAIGFVSNPFESQRFQTFPVRTIDVLYPAVAKGDWTGVKPGDTARYTPVGGLPAYARVKGVRGDLVLLDRYLPEFDASTGGTLSILRAPFDAVKTNSSITNQPQTLYAITVEPVPATKKLNVTGVDGSWVGTYIAVRDEAVPTNSGFHRVNSYGPGYVEVEREGNFQASATQSAQRVDFGEDLGANPVATLPHTSIREGTLVVYGRTFDGNGLVEGRDYVANLLTGELRIISAWDVLTLATASYEWDLVITEVTYSVPGYFTKNYVSQTKEMALWGVDALVDRDVLYQNFGYLLGFRKPTTEQYRAFLKGVAQLYLLGPNASRFESALNVMAGYPVVREDNEELVSFSDGVETTGTGAVFGFNEGRDGRLATSSSRFISSTAGFMYGDIGATITVRVGTGLKKYVISSIISTTTVEVSPTPVDAVDVEWSYWHGAVKNRFVSTAPSFTQDNIGSYLSISAARNARNNGVFRIIAVESPNVVLLSSEFGFNDETGFSWALTKTNKIAVVTNRRTYEFPFNTPMRTDLVVPLKFTAYEALTEAFTVVSEHIDPTWWHHTYIPQEILEDSEPARHYSSPLFVEHVFGATDAPKYGDEDFYFGLDDEGQPPAAREGSAVWLGGSWMTAPEALVARDVGRYVVIKTTPFEGSFKIETVLPDNVTMKLERFPPPEAAAETAPVTVKAKLPALLYRRPTAFILMDRFLKRHAIYVRVDPRAHVSADFMADAAALVKEVRPSHAFVYLESLTQLKDTISLGETFHATLGAGLSDAIPVIDTTLNWLPTAFVAYGDAYTYVEHVFSISYPGGVFTTTLTPPAPYSAPYRYLFLSGRFTDGSVTVSGHTRSFAEDVDYTFDPLTGTLKINQGNAGTLHFSTLSCFLRTRNDGDALLDYETRVSFGGNDPTVNLKGMADRAISIRLSS